MVRDREAGTSEEIMFNRDDLLLALNSVFYDREAQGKAALDKSVFQTLAKIPNEDMKSKIMLSIVLVGGLAELKGFVNELEDRLIARAVSENISIEEVAVIDTSARGFSKCEAVFQGGCILPKLDCFGDILINSGTYLGNFTADEKPEKRTLTGKHYMKEKIPFQW